MGGAANLKEAWSARWRRWRSTLGPTLVPMLGLGLLVLASQATHIGGHSPYTYGWAALGGDRRGVQIDGLHVNPDCFALRIIPLTEGFFRPCGIDFRSGNVGMPLHTYVVAIVLGLARSYMFASLLTNACCLLLLAGIFVVICSQFGMRPGAIVLAGVNVLLLPWVVHYAGQPLNYTFSICLNFVAAAAVIRLAQTGNRNPWLYGLVAATMGLNYDWYVLVGALVLFVTFVHRFERKVDYAKFAVTAAVPVIAWKGLVTWASAGQKVNDLRGDQFFTPVKDAWLDILRHPIHNLYEPFVVSHIGVGMVFKQILAEIYWPILAVVVFLLLRLKPRLADYRWAWFPLLLVVVYAFEQMATAALDWENNPRRALPVVFAFCVALTYIVAKTYDRRAIRALFVVLAVGSFALSFADRFAATPVIQELQTGEAARSEAKWPMQIYGERLDTLPYTPVDAPYEFPAFRPKCEAAAAKDANLGKLRGEFWASQLLLGGVLAAFLILLRRLRWLPPYALAGLGAVFVASLAARFFA
jgi:hypothetical protein